MANIENIERPLGRHFSQAHPKQPPAPSRAKRLDARQPIAPRRRPQPMALHLTADIAAARGHSRIAVGISNGSLPIHFSRLLGDPSCGRCNYTR